MTALVITTNYGVEQDELLGPVAALRDAGIAVTIAAAKAQEISTLVSDQDPGETVHPDTTLGAVSATDYDVLVMPGGTINADALRGDVNARALAAAFAAEGKTIAAICHAPWLLVDTDLAAGKRLTSYASLQPDLRNAGGDWVDEELVSDDTGGWTLLTSRTPDDLDVFNAAVVAAAR